MEHAFLSVVPVIASFGFSLCACKSLSYNRNCVRNPIKSKEVIFKGKVATFCIQFTGRLPELLRPQAEQPLKERNNLHTERSEKAPKSDRKKKLM